MKKIISLAYILFCIFLFTNCIGSKFDIIDNKIDNKIEKIEFLQSTESFYVPVKTGFATIVTNAANNIFAEVTIPMNINIPRDIKPNLLYIPLDEYSNETIVENKTQLYQTICFEDSVVGDYDYNDLIIHVKYQTKGNIFAVGIHPIALGATKKIKLGFILKHRNNIIFDGLVDESDIRDVLFNGKSGFINTYNENISKIEKISNSFDIIKKFKLEGIGADIPTVEWYILVDNNIKLYALSTSYSNQSFDKNGLPYGIIITDTGSYYDKQSYNTNGEWFNYIEETHHIKDVYPYIWDWMIGNSTFDFTKMYITNQSKNKIPASEKNLYIINNTNIL